MKLKRLILLILLIVVLPALSSVQSGRVFFLIDQSNADDNQNYPIKPAQEATVTEVEIVHVTTTVEVTADDSAPSINLSALWVPIPILYRISWVIIIISLGGVIILNIRYFLGRNKNQ